jgi:hypothetical protein
MSATQVHLMMNHLPVLGSLLGLVLLGAGMARKSEELKRTSLLILLAAAVAALPVYLSGEPAEKHVQGLPGVGSRDLEKHKEVAQLALSVMLVVGGLSGSAFWLFRRGSAVPNGFVMGVMAAAILSCGLMAWTAHLGGQVRHTEIRPSSTGQP